ncbi:MAG: asparagine synthase (glutamine-hydrolyzing) [Candidatus Aminicenantes bacterium]|nr:asparagine synthase (glutamine-hydrolyzing) [Candidatus Aminicenantes bacterium]
MCGICGIYGFNGLGPEAENITKKMCSVMVHRGPDDEGYYSDGKVSLGMRRLSIIDLVTGHQPMSNEDKSVWVILNGEIYNFPELREQLIQKGHTFTTKSDTEVIAHLYEEEGEDFVSRLNGMFAIALWDKKTNTFCLVRDRLGIKPLHYWQSDKTLVFSSEIKSILQADYQRKLDFDGMSRFFTFEYIPAPQTIFRGIKKLLPGHMIVVTDTKTQIKPYWDVSHAADTDSNASEETIMEEIYERLKESVKKRLISDVPLGVFLSGGMDSSSITALMSEVAVSKIKTFSIGFKEETFNELGYAKIVADRFQTDHQEFVVESNLVRELVPKLIEYLDEPLADASIIPTYIISNLARKYVTVALAGEGGDELFAGYDTYKAYQVARLYRRVPKIIRNGIVKNIVRMLPASGKRLSFEFKAKKFISGIDYPPEISNFIWWGAYGPAEKEKLFAPDIHEKLSEDLFAPIFYHLNNSTAEDTVSRLGYLDLKLYLQDDLLVKTDRMSMANSLEIRVPFLDHTFVEYAATIPSFLKLKRLKTKHILKKAMAPYLPPEILTRKKIGFDIPLGIWIRNELKDFVTDVLSPTNLNKHGFFNQATIDNLLKEHFQGAHNHRQLLWPLIIFQFWYNHYME